MANNIKAQVSGGEVKSYDGVDTVGDVRKKLGLNSSYVATVNGEPEDDECELDDYNFVAFAPAVKGGSR